MQKPTRPGLFAVILVVVVTGAFVGLTTAHDAGDDRAHDECEMAHGTDDCPMMDGMMGGMMQMDDECPMKDREGMMGGMHSDSAEGHDHVDCSMR